MHNHQRWLIPAAQLQAQAAGQGPHQTGNGQSGPDHPNIARDVNNLGLVLQNLGDLTGAREAFERALGISEKFLPADHPKIRIVQESLERLGWRDG